jgi:hypothetical protein
MEIEVSRSLRVALLFSSFVVMGTKKEALTKKGALWYSFGNVYRVTKIVAAFS